MYKQTLMMNVSVKLLHVIFEHIFIYNREEFLQKGEEAEDKDTGVWKKYYKFRDEIKIL